MRGKGMLGKCSHEVIVDSWALRHGRSADSSTSSTRAHALLSRFARYCLVAPWAVMHWVGVPP